MINFKLEWIIYLLIIFLQFKWSRCDISSILFPFNTIVDQNLDNKNQELRNLSLRNRYQPNYSSNQDFKNTNTNLLNKLSSDKQKNLNMDRSVVVPDLYCEKEEWLCHDKLRCIWIAQICDKIQNCIDSSDELDCHNKCRGDEFKCKKSGRCIPNNWVCDDQPDCGSAGDLSDELNCIGTGKIPKLTGNLKMDLDSFESIENQNLLFATPTEHINLVKSKTEEDHPNKHPDSFNNLFNNKHDKNPIFNHPNRQNSKQNINYQIDQNKQKSDQNKNQVLTDQFTNESNNQTKALSIKTNKLDLSNGKDANKKENQSILTNQSKTSSTTPNYEAPYIKIFPLTPVVKTTESVQSNVAYNNYAILTNKLVNTTNPDKANKSLIESLGFNTLNNKSVESPKQEITTLSKTIKLGQNDNKTLEVTKTKQNLQTNARNSNAQALNSQGLANEKKNY